MATTQMFSLSRFAAKLPVGSADRIWLGPLRAFHAGEKHTEADWWAIINELRTRPVAR